MRTNKAMRKVAKKGPIKAFIMRISSFFIKVYFGDKKHKNKAYTYKVKCTSR